MADVRQFSDAEIERLVKFYEQAEREILDHINRALLRGNNIEYLAKMKKNIEAILQQLRDGNRTWCTEAIPRVYSQGLYSAEAMLKDVGASVKAGFGAIHQQAAQVLAENAYQRFEDVVQVIGRQVNDIYRELALENVRGTVVGYDTWQQVANRYREQLAERGVTGFKDRAGKMWNMRTYTEMVARTTTMEAHLQGTANRLVEQGHDLVKVSIHLGACELCVPWQGKILSITGKTKGYPTLEEAKAAGLFHPNCRHAYGLYIDLDLDDEEKEAKDNKITKSVSEMTKEELIDFMHSIDAKLDKYGLLPQSWNGELKIDPNMYSRGDGYGQREWDKSITVAGDALQEKTFVHELLHGRSNGVSNVDVNEAQSAYCNHAALEEGVVESLTKALCKKEGWKYETTSYETYVNGIREAKNIFAKDVDDIEFYSNLLKMPLRKRGSYLKNEIEKVFFPPGTPKTEREIIKAHPEIWKGDEKAMKIYEEFLEKERKFKSIFMDQLGGVVFE